MELIPILSTIILVATISTFILAVGAYILYKIREGKVSVSPERKPEYLEAEYFVPKEKKEHKVFIEEVIEPKPKAIINAEGFEPVKPISEKQTESKYRVVEDFGSSSDVKSVSRNQVVMPKMKFEKYNLPSDETVSKDSFQEEIKWR
ncbi:MAG TPA: hypothetical protein VLH59_00095 [Ignavibacteriaceae bacterium]|nr:hypothetical protein [Ignavibacteriaceae bacterium]